LIVFILNYLACFLLFFEVSFNIYFEAILVVIFVWLVYNVIWNNSNCIRLWCSSKLVIISLKKQKW